MLGFGFNKTKVFSAAERFVQQGKLQNAIVEYEKISREDPKDLTVLNTIGDLYSRIGQVEQAVTCFRKVGDAYAAQGFTVKAIAMYKKLTKLSPSAIECTQKLAELYTQQGLFNDARSQYVQVADSHMRNGQLDDAARIFQKMLELDPENSAMRTKLADLYVKLGKSGEAKSIFFNAAESLLERNMLPAAEEALGRVLALDPQNSRALEMRARVALESGNAAAAITFLEMLPDLDSRADALRSLMSAYLQCGRGSEIEPIARKLFAVHHDISGITAYGDHLMSAGEVTEALKFFGDFEDRLLASDSGKFTQALYGCVSRVKNDAAALDHIRQIFIKASDTNHTAEVTELLAHALVQAGELARARDLYKELMELEPENPLHAQNHRQIIARLGTDAADRPLTPEEGGQAFLVDELEPVTAVVVQEYPEETANAIQTALTDSELFDSYNVPAKAIPPLEAALPRAPKDIRLNQRLASLYSRTGRLADAARCCMVMEEVYRIGEYRDEANQFRDMAVKYAEKAGIPLPSPETISATPPATTVGPEFFETGDLQLGEDEGRARFAAAAPTETFVDFLSPKTEAVQAEPFVAQSVAGETIFIDPAEEFAEPETAARYETPATDSAATPTAATEAKGLAHEFDLSDEWETELAAIPTGTDAVPAHELEAVPVFEVGNEITIDHSAADLLEEITFYISQQMWTEASSAVENLASLEPAHQALPQFRAQIAAGREASTAAPEEVLTADPLLEAGFIADEGSVAEFTFEPEAPNAQPIITELAAVPAENVFEIPEFEPVAQQSTREEEFVAPPAPEVPVEASAPEVAAAGFVSSEPASISEFALDLEDSLGEDFTLAPAPTFAPQPEPIAAPAAAVMAPPVTVPVAPVASAAVAPIAAAAAPALLPELAEEQETNSVLADMFAEFKEDVEDESSAQDEDPETHYNLGVAFKEMGLLDEAIGELQKVAQAIDRGAPFSQTMQVYTWLAQSFVDKGIPEASYRWYEKALKLAKDDEIRTAIHYEFGSAYESAGNKPQALAHFTEVYGSNIDYRDVAERIKALKS